MKIYTRKGDSGQTGIWGGRRLRNFILPGGRAAAAALHVARGACRRAERRVATLSRTEDTVPVVPAYLNRLAGMLFVAARYANHEAGDPTPSGAGRPAGYEAGGGVRASGDHGPG